MPTFNSEEYISNLLDSIVRQYEQFSGRVEFIFVDDGSKDRTEAQVEKYKDCFPLTWLPLEHGGVSHARNYGIDHAKGKYVMFVDSDDELHDIDYASLEKLFLDSPDLIFCDLKLDKVETVALNHQNRASILQGIIGIGERSLGWGIHSKCYRTDVLRGHSIRFDRNLRVAEDIIFNFDTIVNASSLILSNSAIYKKNPSSSMHLFKLENLNNELYFRQRFIQVLERSHLVNDQLIMEKLSVTGFLFLIDRYFVPGILAKELTFEEALAQCNQLFYEYDYARYFKQSQSDLHLGKRMEVLKKILSKGNIRLAFILQIIFSKMKGKNI